ncbi:MAG: acyltransferase family protein, partial [Janthinobacterium lividum]
MLLGVVNAPASMRKDDLVRFPAQFRLVRSRDSAGGEDVVADRNYLLDGLRGVAALIVVSYHMQADPSGGAYLAVDFFFGLSGFVIAAAYDARFTAGMGFGGFMRLRVIRLYPLLALGI